MAELQPASVQIVRDDGSGGELRLTIWKDDRVQRIQNAIQDAEWQRRIEECRQAAGRGDLEGATEALRAIDSPEFRAEAFGALGKGLMDAGLVTEAKQAFTVAAEAALLVRPSDDFIQVNPPSPQKALVRIAAVQLRLDMQADARTTSGLAVEADNERDDERSEAVVFWTLARILGDRGKHALASHLFQQAGNKVFSIESLRHRSNAVNDFLEELVKAGLKSQAVSIARELEEHGNIGAYAVLLAEIGKAETGYDKQAARETLSAALEAAAQLDAESRESTLLRCIAGLTELGDFDRAEAAVESIVDQERRVWELAGLKQKRAETSSREMAKINPQQAIAEAKQKDDVIDRLLEIGQTLADAAKSDDGRQAVRAAYDVAAAAPAPVSTFTRIADAFMKVELPDEAQAAIRRAESQLSSSGVQEPAEGPAVNRERELADLAEAAARCGMGKLALDLMSRRYQHPRSFAYLAANLAKAGDKQHVAQCLIPCADDIIAARSACVALARLYPGVDEELALLLAPDLPKPPPDLPPEIKEDIKKVKESIEKYGPEIRASLRIVSLIWAVGTVAAAVFLGDRSPSGLLRTPILGLVVAVPALLVEYYRFTWSELSVLEKRLAPLIGLIPIALILLGAVASRLVERLWQPLLTSGPEDLFSKSIVALTGLALVAGVVVNYRQLAQFALKQTVVLIAIVSIVIGAPAVLSTGILALVFGISVVFALRRPKAGRAHEN